MNPRHLRAHTLRSKARHVLARPRYRVALAAAALAATASTIGAAASLVNDAPAGTELTSAMVPSDRITIDPLTASLTDKAGTPPVPASPDKETASKAAVTDTAASKASAGKTSAPEAKKTTPAPAPAPSSKTLTYKFAMQTTYYYCGPAATRIALSAKGHTLSQDAIAQKLGTTTDGTNSAADTTRVLNAVNKTNFYRTRFIDSSPSTADKNQLQADVVRAISNGYPLVTNIVGSATDTSGTSHTYSGGHYVSVVGYRDNGKTVKVADPAYGQYWMTSGHLIQWLAQRGYSS